jgi:hypothetical protein
MGERKGEYRVLVEKRGRKPTVSATGSWQDNIKMDIKK